MSQHVADLGIAPGRPRHLVLIPVHADRALVGLEREGQDFHGHRRLEGARIRGRQRHGSPVDAGFGAVRHMDG